MRRVEELSFSGPKIGQWSPNENLGVYAVCAEIFLASSLPMAFSKKQDPGQISFKSCVTFLKRTPPPKETSKLGKH